MSFFQILVCIFLCIHSNLGEISYEDPVNLQSVSLFSCWVSGYAARFRELMRLSYIDHLVKMDAVIKLKGEYCEIEKQIEPLYEYQKVFMTSFQNGDPLPVDQSGKLQELCIKRDEIKNALMENEIQNDHARLVYRRAQKNLKDADTIQDHLQKRAGNLDELQSDGFYNSNHTIQQLDEIPDYGSVHNSNITSDIACLLDGPLDIDSSSDFWLWPVSNGMISAGTWSYPRRCHAFGT